MDSSVLDLFVILQSQNLLILQKKLTITTHAKGKAFFKTAMLTSVAIGAINDAVAIAGALITCVILL